MKNRLWDNRPQFGPALCVMFFGTICGAGAAETTSKPLFLDAAPVCSCESLTNVSLPNSRVESATIDPTDGSCRVIVVVTHPPSGDRVKVFVGLPVTNWN